ncbi:MAG TPA: hypothetical protein QGH36_07010, partial [Candidatus Marinimicrobia bacterium]|nr:hypothetical protein [Candidatus Neomarinimicrobiota bacterium]
ISMHLTEPHTFTISAEELSNMDGYLDISVFDENGDPVEEAYVSVMVNDSILFKGNTDSDGQIEATISVIDLSTIDVYSNKNGFVQGHSEVAVSSVGNDLALIGYEFDDGNENGIIEVGEIVEIYPIIQNVGNSTSSYSGTVNVESSDNCQIISSDIVIPALVNGETVTLSSPIT